MALARVEMRAVGAGELRDRQGEWRLDGLEWGCFVFDGRAAHLPRLQNDSGGGNQPSLPALTARCESRSSAYQMQGPASHFGAPGPLSLKRLRFM